MHHALVPTDNWDEGVMNKSSYKYLHLSKIAQKNA